MSIPAVAISPGTYRSDPVHSDVSFTVRHNVVAKFRGHFNEYSATLEVEEGGSMSLQGTVNVASIVVKEPRLQGHLMSPDFFDVAQYPEITFATTSITVDGENLALEGDLTLKGVTQHLNATGKLVHVEQSLGGDARVGIEIEATIDRTAFGLNWNAPLPAGGFAVSNDVSLLINLELAKAA